MAVPDGEAELLELPAEFEGLPYEARFRAFSIAEAQIDTDRITAKLSLAIAEQCLVLAAAHYLATSGDPNTTQDTPMRMRRGSQVGEGGTPGLWSGSDYGDALSKILDRVNGGGGRRRCSQGIPSPSP